MVKSQLTNFEKVVEQLRQMEVSRDYALEFPMDKYKTVTGTTWRLKKNEGLRFITRKVDENVLVWRVQ